MSDYLKHLAARSLNRTPSIQPRLASRFEPLSPAFAPASPSPASESALDRDQLDSEDGTHRLSPPEAHATARAESRQRTADAATRALDSAPRPLDASTRSGARTGIRPRVDTERSQAMSSLRPPQQSSPPSVFAPPHGRQPAAHTSSQETTDAGRDAPAQGVEDARAGLQHKDDTPAARRPHATNESALERNIRRIVAGEFEARDAEADGSPRQFGRAGDGKRPGVEPVSIVAARADAARAAAARGAADASAQSSPPIIRVTIGRIEVRAVNTPAPPGARGEARPAAAVEARPDPARSLREYLKQRSGGKP